MALRFWFFVFLVNTHLLFSAIPETIQKEIEDFNSQEKFIGFAVGIFYKGEPYFLNFGFADPERSIKVTENTLFDIASITKPFVSTLLAYQVIRNKMNLTDTLDQYIPTLKFHSCALSTITLEQLATHTSGLPRDPGPEDHTEQQVINSLLNWRPEYPPGTYFLYSNLGYKLLRYALVNYENMKFEEILEQGITHSLVMKSTVLHVPSELHDRFARGFNKDGQILPEVNHNSLKSTASDLISFLRANMGLYGPLQLYHAMELAQKGVFQINPNVVQGLGWQNVTQEGFHLIDKNGGVAGFSSWAGWSTPENVGLVLLTNRTGAALTKFGRELLVKLTRLASQNRLPSPKKVPRK